MKRVARTSVVASFASEALVSERSLLVLCLVLVLTLSLAPFNFVSPEHGLGLHDQEQIIVRLDLLKTGAHFLAFFLFGGLIAAINERSIMRIGLGRFMLPVGVFCLGLEILQAFLPSRHARVADLATNALGICVGAVSVLRWSRTRDFWLRIRQHFRSHAISVQIGIVLVTAGIWIGAAVFPVVKLRLDWDAQSHLLIANEIDSSRPWLGEIQSIAIYGQAMTTEQVLHSYKNASYENANGIQALVECHFRPSDKVVETGSLKSEGLSIQDLNTDDWMSNDGSVLLRNRCCCRAQAQPPH